MAGFTKAKEAWLPVDARQRMLAAEKQEKLAESMLHTTRTLMALRKGSAALSRGGFRVIEAQGSLLVFEREAEGDCVRCAFNFGAGDVTLDLGGRPDLLWAHEAVASGNKLVMPGFSAAWLKLA